MAAPRAVILTGERGAGKTTLCLALAASSPRYVGVVSPRVFDEAGHPVGFSVRSLAPAEEWVLARSNKDLDGPRYGIFSFSSAGLERAVSCMREILLRSQGKESMVAGGGGDAAGTIVVIDEIGPLELERGEGLAPVLPLLAGAGHLLLVVRPPLVGRVLALVPRHEREVVVLEQERRASLASMISRRFA